MGLWHLDKKESYLNILNTELLIAFVFLHWFFPYCSASSQLIFKNVLLESPKKHDQTSINLINIFDFIW